MHSEQMDIEWSYTKLIPSEKHVDIKLDPQVSGGYYVFEVNVIDMPGGRNDIRILVYDEDSYKNVPLNLSKGQTGSSKPQTPSPLLSAKLYWGKLYFKPTFVGTYFLILDNTYSQFTLKKVDLKVHWIHT